MKKMGITALLGASALTAFDNSPGWKKNEDGTLAVNDAGDPIYIGGTGQENAITGQTIGQLRNEAAGYRKRLETAEAAVKAFEGLDPETARAAVDKLAGVDLDKMVESGKLEEVRQQITQQFTGKLTDAEKRIASLMGELDTQALTNAFATSQFIRDKIAVPPTMFQNEFGRYFKREDGALIPYDANGNKIYSPTDMSKPASVDEALAILVDNYAFKDAVLKPIGNQGTGNEGNGGNRGSTGRTITRAQFDAMSPAEQSQAARNPEVTITG